MYGSIEGAFRFFEMQCMFEKHYITTITLKNRSFTYLHLLSYFFNNFVMKVTAIKKRHKRTLCQSILHFNESTMYFSLQKPIQF
jgi:hypothetical protein